MSGWTHDGLLDDLAGYLRAPDRMVWTDMQIGPSGSPRPDVFIMQKSYSKPRPLSFEIKVSRSDLRADTTVAKWSSYLKFSEGVVFAVPDGLATLADLPERCGLIVRKKEVWRYVRKPTLAPCTPSRDAFMKLLIDGVGRASKPSVPSPRRVDTWTPNKAVLKKFGEDVATAARDLGAARASINSLKTRYADEAKRIDEQVTAYRERERKRAEEEMRGLNRLRCEITQWLGLSSDAAPFAIEQAFRRIKESCDADERVKSADKRVEQAAYAIRRALAQLERTA